MSGITSLTGSFKSGEVGEDTQQVEVTVARLLDGQTGDKLNGGQAQAVEAAGNDPKDQEISELESQVQALNAQILKERGEAHAYISSVEGQRDQTADELKKLQDAFDNQGLALRAALSVPPETNLQAALRETRQKLKAAEAKVNQQVTPLRAENAQLTTDKIFLERRLQEEINEKNRLEREVIDLELRLNDTLRESAEKDRRLSQAIQEKRTAVNGVRRKVILAIVGTLLAGLVGGTGSFFAGRSIRAHPSQAADSAGVKSINPGSGPGEPETGEGAAGDPDKSLFSEDQMNIPELTIDMALDDEALSKLGKIELIDGQILRNGQAISNTLPANDGKGGILFSVGGDTYKIDKDGNISKLTPLSELQ